MVGSTQLNLSAILTLRAASAVSRAKPTTPAPASLGPAALVSAESLRSTLAYLDAQTSASQRGIAIASTADATLGAVNDLLTEARTLAVANANDAGLSADEKIANNIQISSALSAIDHLATNAKFGDTTLLDGNYKIAANGASLDVSKVSVEALNLSAVKAGTDANPTSAIDSALQTITTLRGRIGAFSQNTLQSELETAVKARTEITSAIASLASTDQAFQVSNNLRALFLSKPETHAKTASHSAGNVLWLIRN